MSEADVAAPVDGRQRRGDERRERIIAAAVRRFARRGYDGTRIADIAKDAGVTDAGLIHHFPTKLSLFLEIVERREAAYMQHDLGEVASVQELFRWHIEGVRLAASEPDYVRFRAMLTGSGLLEGHPIADRLSANLEHALGRLVPIVQRGIDGGELRAGVDAQQVVLELLALNEGIRNQWVTLPDRIDYVAVFSAAAAGLYERVSGHPLVA
ncbi:hypothetical protein ASE14_15445 [Agromyces sp. Root81]|uniref:TetR/AcrR family transcriptional regulator n=1 Tax=Agromyces sp. Root81 TaxID=1736601 RepID=UPI0006F4032B|nr:TetR/AcrR family transcriptional regulator [Agromyces sp. Root81]KRC59169.1 hypothetical protein ASE14_15445 [Agromyces sp. Root81]